MDRIFKFLLTNIDPMFANFMKFHSKNNGNKKDRMTKEKFFNFLLSACENKLILKNRRRRIKEVTSVKK